MVGMSPTARSPWRSPIQSSLVALSLVVAISGCAALQPRPTSYTAFGEADPARDRAVIEGYDALLDSTAKRADVKVLVDTLPAGVSLKDGTISVEDGAPFELVGKFSVGTKSGFFPDYKDGWRKGLCYRQQPLFIVTGFIWGVAPTYWPCFYSGWPGGVMSREDAIVASRLLAESAGANVVLLSYVGNGDAVGQGTGFLLKTDLSTFDPKKTHPKDASPAQALRAPRPDAPASL
jgi:hypothetical protein